MSPSICHQRSRMRGSNALTGQVIGVGLMVTNFISRPGNDKPDLYPS